METVKDMLDGKCHRCGCELTAETSVVAIVTTSITNSFGKSSNSILVCKDCAATIACDLGDDKADLGLRLRFIRRIKACAPYRQFKEDELMPTKEEAEWVFMLDELMDGEERDAKIERILTWTKDSPFIGEFLRACAQVLSKEEVNYH